MQTPASVIEAVIRAANQGDLDRMMDYFAEDAVLSLNPTLPERATFYRGRGEIRRYIEDIVRRGFRVQSGEISSSGDEASWHAQVSGGPFDEAGIERAEVATRATVQGGQIQAIDIHYTPETVRQLEAARQARA